MNKTRRRALAGAAAVVAAGIGAAAAQMPGGQGRQQGRTGGGPPGSERRDGALIAANLADQARTQLLELEDDLKPTAAQRAVWAGYYDKVSRLADDVVRNRNEVRFPKGTAPEQLDFIAQTVRNRMTAVEDIADAGKALYAVLNAEQKAMADNRLARIPLPLVVPTLAVADQIGRFPPRNAAPPVGNDR